ncbi:MAG: type II toxin-antitoxin system HicA family toxin [Candidatus Bathyarchaeia archaeon]
MPSSSKLPSLSWRDVLKALGKIGFVPVRQSGSHLILRNKVGVRISVPRHDPIGKGLLMEIVAEAGITKDEFLKLL